MEITWVIAFLLSGSVWSWKVSQWPESVHVCKGDSIVLRCTITHHVTSPSAATFLWFWKDVTIYEFNDKQGIKENNITILGDPRVSLKSDLSGSSLMTIGDVTPEDNALFSCAVIIHSPLPITNKKGNGTLVSVVECPFTGTSSSPLDNSTFPTSHPNVMSPLVLLRLILFLTFVLIVTFIYLWSWIYVKFWLD